MIEQFLDYMKDIMGRSETTIDGYRNDMNIFYDYLKTRFKCKEVTEKTINKVALNDLHAYVTYLSKTRHNSSKSKARKIACLKSFFKYLRLMNIVGVNPAVDLDSPKIEQRLPVYLSLEQANKLLSSVNGNNHAERDYAIIMLYLNCGLRLSELMEINIEDLQGDTLSVIGKGNKERTIYLNDVCQDAIKTYLQVRPKASDKALFISNRKTRFGKRGIQHMVNKYFNQADLHGFTVHKLRHTAATLMYQSGVDIKVLQEILGHESVATTQIYTHTNKEQLRNAVNKNPLNIRGN